MQDSNTIRENLSAAIRDPLYLLIAAQALFIVLGKSMLEFNVGWGDITTALVVAVVCEFALSTLRAWYKGNPLWKFSFPGGAIAAALGIGIFFRATSPWYFALAALVAIGSKYAIRLGGRHIFNPSNIAIVVLVLLFPASTTTEFTQWGNDPYLYIVIAVISFGIAYRAGVILTTVSFLASYTALLIFFVSHGQFLFSLHHYGLIGPSLVLFASFMITDPKTAPSRPVERVLHGIAVACMFFVLDGSGIRYSLFLASFLVTLLNVASRGIVSVFRRFSRIHLAANAPTSFIALACAAVFGVYVYSLYPQTKPISLEFIFMGVESKNIFQCATNPMLVARTPTEFKAFVTSGVAWGDFDKDGFDDLFISSIDVPSGLYKNNHDGTFTDVTGDSGLPVMNSSSAFFADYDNDAKEDLFVVAGDFRAAPALNVPPGAGPLVQPVRVFKNTGGGKFMEVTDQLKLTDQEPMRGGTLSFADFNNDGFLDFVLAEPARMTDLTPSENRALQKSLFDMRIPAQQAIICQKDEVKRIFSNLAGPRAGISASLFDTFVDQGACLIVARPLMFSGGLFANAHERPFAVRLLQPGHVALYKNAGGKSLIRTNGLSALVDAALKRTTISYFTVRDHPYDVTSPQYFQPLAFDYDGDDMPDVFQSIDFGSNLLLRNIGNFNFEDVTSHAGLDYAGSGMGVDVADFDSNGTPDIAANNVFETYLYANKGDGTFDNRLGDILNEGGIPWGMSFIDYDLDGKEDLYVGNGDVQVTSYEPSTDIDRSAFRIDRLYHNDGQHFSDRTGADMCSRAMPTRPVAVSDYNNDGTPDIFVGSLSPRGQTATETAARSLLYENMARKKNGNHYLAVRLHGTASNADAVGSIVKVTSQNVTQTKFLLLGTSFYSENSKTLLFGLGTSTASVAVSVHWPSGRTTNLTSVHLDERIDITE